MYKRTLTVRDSLVTDGVIQIGRAALRILVAHVMEDRYKRRIEVLVYDTTVVLPSKI